MVSNFDADDEDEEEDLAIPERYRTVTTGNKHNPNSDATGTEHGQTEFKYVLNVASVPRTLDTQMGNPAYEHFLPATALSCVI